jgi:TPR repeat protein
MNRRKASQYFRFAADQGFAAAQCGYGICLQNGDGVSMNRCEAATYFKLAADQGFAVAQHIGCPTSSVAQANLTIKTNFNILRSFSSSDILTI